MARTLEQLALEMLGLPAASRALLAERLIASLEEEEAVAADAESRWKGEAERRAQEISRGTVVCRPADEVFRRATDELK